MRQTVQSRTLSPSKADQQRFVMRSALLAGLILGCWAHESHAATYAPWLKQIGINDSIMSAGNWGKGQVLAVVDTGINPNHAAFAAGQVSTTLSSCAAVTFKCSNGYMDDNGHGTSVAAIAAGNKTFSSSSSYGGYTVTANSVISVAPNANIIAEKVLNAAGSGYSTDVANGIRKAADAGASVINLSLTWGNTSDKVAAINYAASKGAFIVWAGGNDAKALLSGANTSGLTATAISRLILVGSVSPTNSLSSFSNTPGTGGLVSTTNAKTNYSARWIMAPGQSIIAPYVTAGNNAWGYWTGTSMAAPVISGALLLLQSAWPILKTNGTAANLLLSTTTDLGAVGIDTTYGTGLANLTKAFQPYGSLTVTKTNGSSVAVTSLTGSMITSGALGSLSAVQSKLANYTAFDSYTRNFSVNLSGLIKSPSTTASLNPLPTNVNSGPTKIKLANGAELGYWQGSEANPADLLGRFAYNAENAIDRRIGYALLTDTRGATLAMGYGYPAGYAYGRALYGNDEMARLADESGILQLNGLAQGGGLFSYGVPWSETTRIAVSWSGNPTPATPANALGTPDWQQASGNQFNAGITHQLDANYTVGVNLGVLNERHGLMGSTYETGSALDLGAQNRTYNLGLALGMRLDASRNLLLEAGFATTRAVSGTGLLAGASDVHARAWGVTYLQKDLQRSGDQLLFSVKQPLRVSNGQIGVMMPGVDADGVPVYQTEWASLVPDGREIDYKLAYTTPLTATQILGLQALVKRDAYNIAGNNNASIGATWAMKF